MTVKNFYLFKFALSVFIVVWTVVVLSCVIVIMGNRAILAYNKAHNTGISAYDATKVCQSIAATATNSSWSYKGCLQELQQSLQPQAVSYTT